MHALAHCKPLGQVHTAQGMFLLSSAQGVAFDAGREDAPALLLAMAKVCTQHEAALLLRSSHTFPHLPHRAFFSAMILGLQ